MLKSDLKVSLKVCPVFPIALVSGLVSSAAIVALVNSWPPFLLSKVDTNTFSGVGVWITSLLLKSAVSWAFDDALTNCTTSISVLF